MAMCDENDVWLCRCECGREELVCGECLRAGRITECSECRALKETEAPALVM